LVYDLTNQIEKKRKKEIKETRKKEKPLSLWSSEYHNPSLIFQYEKKKKKQILEKL